MARIARSLGMVHFVAANTIPHRRSVLDHHHGGQFRKLYVAGLTLHKTLWFGTITVGAEHVSISPDLKHQLDPHECNFSHSFRESSKQMNEDLAMLSGFGLH
jgi:hypothetical protein